MTLKTQNLPGRSEDEALALPDLYPPGCQGVCCQMGNAGQFILGALSDTAQGTLNTLVGQRIGPLIAGVAVVAPDPAPVDGVAA